jgi:hypothetical protein
MNIEVPTKYLLSHSDRIVVFEILLHTESPMLYRPALHGNCIAKASGISSGPCSIVKFSHINMYPT